MEEVGKNSIENFKELLKNRNIYLDLLSVNGEELNITNILKDTYGESLADVKCEGDIFTLTFIDNVKMSMRKIRGELVKNQINSLYNHYQDSEIKDINFKNAILKQIEMINTIFKFEFEFYTDKELRDTAVNRVYDFAKQTASIVVYKDKTLYSAEHKLIISNDGSKSDYKEYYPIVAKSYVLNNDVPISKNDEERKSKNIELIKNMGLPYYEDMEMIPKDSNTTLQDEKSIFEALVKWYTVATIATSIKEKGQDKLFNDIYEKLNKLYNIDTLFNAGEKKMLTDIRDGISPYRNEMTWEYETVAILMWALSLWDFPKQDDECNVNLMNDILYYIDDTADLMKRIKLKTKEEIMEKADYLCRLKWACEELRIQKVNPPVKLHEKVISMQKNIIMQILNCNF